MEATKLASVPAVGTPVRGFSNPRAMVVLVAIGAALSFVNILFEFVGMRIATGQVDLGGVSGVGSSALALVLLALTHYGSAVAGLLFGRWPMPPGSRGLHAATFATRRKGD